MAVSISGSGAITGMVSADSSDLSTALAAKGDIAGETWTGTHDFTGATVTGVGGGGLVLIEPTSIAYSGGSASSTSGTTTFTGVSSISLNGVFSATYANYFLAIRFTLAVSGNLLGRMRTSGTDNTSASYTSQAFYGWGSSVGASRLASQNYARVAPASTAQNSTFIDLSDPFGAFRTIATGKFTWAGASSTMESHLDTWGFDNTTSFDGMTLYPDSSTMTGVVRVYGYEGA